MHLPPAHEPCPARLASMSLSAAAPSSLNSTLSALAPSGSALAPSGSAWSSLSGCMEEPSEKQPAAVCCGVLRPNGPKYVADRLDCCRMWPCTEKTVTMPGRWFRK